MREPNVEAKKRLGQHFLTNTGAIAKIITALEPSPGDRFLEIGPGPGALTLPLHRLGYPLTLVELDGDMVARLRQQELVPPPTIIQADFLDLEIAHIVTPGVKVVSNLPYNASVPITARLLTMASRIPLMVLMYQKEVAERIRAKPGTKAYGLISVLCRFFYHVDAHFNLSPGSFSPPPKVQSQVIRLRRETRPLLHEADLPRVTQLLRFLFNRRRKMLGTLLKTWQAVWMDRDCLLESLAALGLDRNARPENLNPQQYAAWFRYAKEQHDRATN